MNVRLSLSPEETDELQRRALAAGTDVKTFLLHVIRDTGAVAEESVSEVPYDQWKHDFRSWITRAKSRNPNLGDRRESIYD